MSFIALLLLTFIMSWALAWVGKPFIWTKCSGDETFPDCTTCPELSIPSPHNSVEWRKKNYHKCWQWWPTSWESCKHVGSCSQQTIRVKETGFREHTQQGRTHYFLFQHRSHPCHLIPFLQEHIQVLSSLCSRPLAACHKANAFAFDASYWHTLLCIWNAKEKITWHILHLRREPKVLRKHLQDLIPFQLCSRMGCESHSIVSNGFDEFVYESLFQLAVTATGLLRLKDVFYFFQ